MRNTARTAIAVSALGLGAAVLPAAVSAPAQGATTQLCSFTYANPNLFVIQASSTASATQIGSDTVTFTLKTNSMSLLGYQQTFRVTWANLVTGKNGGGDVRKRVVGSANTLTVPNLKTGKGRIALVLAAANTSSIGPGSTNGDCGKELRVG